MHANFRQQMHDHTRSCGIGGGLPAELKVAVDVAGQACADRKGQEAVCQAIQLACTFPRSSSCTQHAELTRNKGRQGYHESDSFMYFAG